MLLLLPSITKLFESLIFEISFCSPYSLALEGLVFSDLFLCKSAPYFDFEEFLELGLKVCSLRKNRSCFSQVFRSIPIQVSPKDEGFCSQMGGVNFDLKPHTWGQDFLLLKLSCWRQEVSFLSLDGWTFPFTGAIAFWGPGYGWESPFRLPNVCRLGIIFFFVIFLWFFKWVFRVLLHW